MSEIRTEGTHTFTNFEAYKYTDDPNVLKKIEWFKDQKLGFMSHFGIYNHYGIAASWPLSDEIDNDSIGWSQRQIGWTDDIEKFKKDYFDSYKAFNPECFEPKVWADEIKRLGFNYAIITTKHHDGFCLWDTTTTEFKSTSDLCYYSKNKYSNIIPNLYEEFKKNDIGIGVYFSKPDWSRDEYWEKNEKYAQTRNVNYDTNQKRDKWEKFIDFAHKQVKELVIDNGPVDILWLDGGWVRKENNQDFHLEELVPELRNQTKDLLVCDRTVGGEFENYVTPEQEIPNDKTDVPWESCITIGENFAYRYDAKYKNPDTLIDIFVDVLTKGGNLVINVSPQPNGKLPEKAISVLNVFSEWVEKNNDAIFGTRPVLTSELPLTKSKDSKKTYYFHKNDSGLIYKKYIYIKFIDTDNIKILGSSEELKFIKHGDVLKVELPQNMVGKNAESYIVFKIEN